MCSREAGYSGSNLCKLLGVLGNIRDQLMTSPRHYPSPRLPLKQAEHDAAENNLPATTREARGTGLGVTSGNERGSIASASPTVQLQAVWQVRVALEDGQERSERSTRPMATVPLGATSPFAQAKGQRRSRASEQQSEQR